MGNLKIGDKVKIDMDLALENLRKSTTSIMTIELVEKALNDFNEENPIHTITGIYVKNPCAKDKTYRYLLDNDYMFNKEELIKL